LLNANYVPKINKQLLYYTQFTTMKGEVMVCYTSF
jgi:hypothetical protein